MEIKINYKEEVRIRNNHQNYIDMGTIKDSPIIYTCLYPWQLAYKYTDTHNNFKGILFIDKLDWTISEMKELLKKYKLERVK